VNRTNLVRDQLTGKEASRDIVVESFKMTSKYSEILCENMKSNVTGHQVVLM